VLGRALARGREPDDTLWFGPGPRPGPAELAARYGDATGLGVHPGPQSARYLWLDRARQHPSSARPLLREQAGHV